MNLKQFLDYRLTQYNFIHDFSLGALLTYHRLQDLYEYDDRVILNESFVLFKPNKKITNLFLYGDRNIDFSSESNFDINNFDINTKISSTKPILNYDVTLKMQSKQEEIFYQINKLEKKYHSYNKPINIFEKRPDLGLELKIYHKNQQNNQH